MNPSLTETVLRDIESYFDSGIHLDKITNESARRHLSIMSQLADEDGLHKISSANVQSEYDEGMNTFSEMIQVDETSPDKNNRMVVCNYNSVVILYNLAKVHQRMGRMNDALRVYHGSFRMANSLDKLQRIHIAILHGIGRIEYLAENYESAFHTYTMAWEFARKLFGNVHLDVASTLNCLGVVLHRYQDVDISDTLKFLQESLRIRRMLLSEVHPDIATTLNNIGRVYFHQEEYCKAINAHREALSIRLAIYSKDHIDVAAVSFNLGQAHHGLGNLDKAMAYYFDYLKNAKQQLGSNHQDVATVSSFIAEIYNTRNDFDNALKFLEDVLRIERAIFGNMHPNIAITLNKIGTAHFKNQNNNEAMQCYKEGLMIEKEVFDANHPNIIITLANIAQVYVQQKQYEKAFNLYSDVYFRQNSDLKDGQTNTKAAFTLKNMMHILCEMGEYERAYETFHEWLRVFKENAIDNEKIEIANILTKIGVDLMLKGMQDLALEAHMQSLSLLEEVHSTGHNDISFSLYNIAMIYEMKGDLEHAMAYFEETLQIEISVLENNHKDVAMTLCLIGDIQYRMGDVDKALMSFEKALEIERSLEDTNYVSVGKTLNKIGNIYLEKGEIEKAIKTFTTAQRICQETNISDLNLISIEKLCVASVIDYPQAAAAA